jgi:hypothetical protein
MQRKALILLSILGLSLALGLSASAAQKTIEELRAKLDKANGGERAKIYAEIAELQVPVADDQFNKGNSVEGHKTVNDIVETAAKARELAISSRDQRKEVEIILRNTQRLLENMKRTLAQIDRPAIDEAEKQLGNFRQELLDSMFAPKKKKEGP